MDEPTRQNAEWINDVEQQVTQSFDEGQLVANLSEQEKAKLRAAMDEVEGMPEYAFVAKRGVRDQKGSFAMQVWVTLDGGSHVVAFPLCLWDDRIEAAREAAIALSRAYERALAGA